MKSIKQLLTNKLINEGGCLYTTDDDITIRYKGKKVNANYYKHIARMSIGDLKKEINDYIKDEEQIINQIKINGDICNKKHNWVMVGMLSLLPCIIWLLNLIIIISFVL